DPTGGTNPNAQSVQWGPQVWPFSRLTMLEHRAVAAGSTMTLFVRVHNPRSHGADQIFIDGVWMRLDQNAPVVATATSVPPRATAVPATPIPPSRPSVTAKQVRKNFLTK
ncbi:MAG: hypothetical protein H0T73_23700, partial [Ardenticatenales bacterium]|nr:hypothetical protein [Ardenticatenales bacterium]